MDFKIEYVKLPGNTVHTEIFQATDKESVRFLFDQTYPHGKIKKLDVHFQWRSDVSIESLAEPYEFYYHELRAYGFHFGDEIGEPIRNFSYAQGYISCFIQFHVPKERQHIFFRMMEEMENPQFEKMVKRFADEDWKRSVEE